MKMRELTEKARKERKGIVIWTGFKELHYEPDANFTEDFLNKRVRRYNEGDAKIEIEI